MLNFTLSFCKLVLVSLKLNVYSVCHQVESFYLTRNYLYQSPFRYMRHVLEILLSSCIREMVYIVACFGSEVDSFSLERSFLRPSIIRRIYD